jgi:hypothetical protein
MSVSINNGVQIAFGSDGLLYAIAPTTGNENGSEIYYIDENVGILTEVPEGEIIIVDDSFSDLSSGPVM